MKQIIKHNEDVIRIDEFVFDENIPILVKNKSSSPSKWGTVVKERVDDYERDNLYYIAWVGGGQSIGTGSFKELYDIFPQLSFYAFNELNN